MAIRLTRDQKRALERYELKLRMEDNFLGSVFVTPVGQRRVEEETKRAYQACVALGMTHEHGL